MSMEMHFVKNAIRAGKAYQALCIQIQKTTITMKIGMMMSATTTKKRIIPNDTSGVFRCNLCNFNFFEIEEGKHCYLISRQKASIKEEAEGERAIFPLSKIGFRFCDECWEMVAGEKYRIEML